jgi:hypothetical protein
MEMAARLPAFLPRLAVIVLLGLALTATLTYAAGRNLDATPVPAVTAAPKAVPLVVPDVRNQAFVFAKGTLEDGGFAWRVDGSVHGYASNTVVGQSPAPGSKIVDTGAPLVILTLRRTSGYTQTGEAEDVSPYAPTSVQSAELASTLGPAAPATSTNAATTTRGTTTQATTTTAPAPKPPTPAKKTTTPATRWPQHRPPAFTVAGAHAEPLNEMPLPARAQALRKWLEAHPRNTSANVAHWLYQNEWIVAGAKLGWWRGAEALATLVAVDRHTQQLWGVGAKSALLAQRVLGEVQSRSK